MLCIEGVVRPLVQAGVCSFVLRHHCVVGAISVCVDKSLLSLQTVYFDFAALTKELLEVCQLQVYTDTSMICSWEKFIEL